MTQGCFQKIADRHRRQAVLFAAGFESKDILFLNLYLCRVLNQDNALMVWNELRQNISESCLATRCSPADENVLALGNVILQLAASSAVSVPTSMRSFILNLWELNFRMVRATP